MRWPDNLIPKAEALLLYRKLQFVSSCYLHCRVFVHSSSWSSDALLVAVWASFCRRHTGCVVSLCSPTDSYLPDLFLGDFLFRVERSNFAEAGARTLLLITISFEVVPFP